MSATNQYSLEEVKEHKGHTIDDPTWIVIHNNVYDITKFLEEHPGGEEILFDNSGGDATESFEDVGHSSDARELMKTYKIGVLRDEDQVAKQPVKDLSKSLGGVKEASGGLMTYIFPLAMGLLAVMGWRLLKSYAGFSHMDR